MRDFNTARAGSMRMKR